MYVIRTIVVWCIHIVLQYSASLQCAHIQLQLPHYGVWEMVHSVHVHRSRWVAVWMYVVCVCYVYTVAPPVGLGCPRLPTIHTCVPEGILWCRLYLYTLLSYETQWLIVIAKRDGKGSSATLGHLLFTPMQVSSSICAIGCERSMTPVLCNGMAPLWINTAVGNVWWLMVLIRLVERW